MEKYIICIHMLIYITAGTNFTMTHGAEQTKWKRLQEEKAPLEGRCTGVLGTYEKVRD